MMINRVIIIFMLCLTINLTISPLDALLEPKRREKIIPYLMESDHPIKSRLDKFFSKSRVIHSRETLKAAGFQNVRVQGGNKILVIKHPSFPGYIFKTYIDKEPHWKNKHEEKFLVSRVMGAQMIQKEIIKNRLSAKFKVPKKWIYELPEFPEPTASYPKYTLLVEEDMGILSNQANLKMWASEKLSTDLLDGLRTIVHAVSLHDVKPDNQPFCRDGRIAFIDTASINRDSGYVKLTKHLSPWHQDYWISINEK